MELPSLPFLCTFLILLFMFVKKAKIFISLQSNSKLLPGPWKLPFIGSVHHLLSGLPHHTLRNLATQHGPIMHLQLGEISTIVISSPKMAKVVMNTHDLMFIDRPFIFAINIATYGCKDLVFAPYGNYWRQMRKICILELLSAKRVKSFETLRQEEVSNLIQSISSTDESMINLSAKISSLTNNIVAKAVFGEKCKDKKAFLSLSHEVNQLAGGFGVADLFPSMKFLHVINGMKSKMKRIHQKLDKILSDIIQEHKQKREANNPENEEYEEDLVDVLLRIQKDTDLELPMANDNLKAVIYDIFSGGSETSSTVIEWAMSEMLKNPKVMEKAQAEVRRVLKGKGNINETHIHELSYLKSVIKETLRLHPPLPLLLPRECREGCEVDGYEIPVKTKVIVNAWAIGRDPEYWSDADMFEPDRFNGISMDYKGTNFEYIPFGAGRRICPGILFGVTNVELPLAQLLYHFDWKLPNGVNAEELDMTEDFGIAVRRRNDLYLVPTPYIT